MARLLPDPTFYASPRDAVRAPAEELGYVALLDPARKRPDAMGVVDLNPRSPTYASMVGRTDMPNVGDELHHFGWNACSTSLCPWAPHPHLERRYLVVPGINSSRVHILDTKPDPRSPRIVKVLEPEEIARKTGYASPHTVHCGPDGIYLNALGRADTGDGPGGLFVLDHETFEPTGPWERDRGPQYLAYDFAWHLGHDAVVTSEWGTPNMVREGLNPELLLGGKYGNQLHVWDLRKRRHVETLPLGAQYQITLELRAARDPGKAYGFAGVTISLADLSASIWLWHRATGNGGGWKVQKVIDIPAEPADPDLLPALLKGFKAVPPLVTDINLSVDDRFLYVSCWGTGELRQYDVTDPFAPVFTGSVKLGYAIARTPITWVGCVKSTYSPDMPKSNPPGRSCRVAPRESCGRRAYGIGTGFSGSVCRVW